MTSILDKLYAILRRDLLTAVRHRSGFVVTLVGVFTELAAFYFLSRAIGPGFRPGGVEYFPFLLVGTGVYTFFVMSAQAFLSAVLETWSICWCIFLLGWQFSGHPSTPTSCRAWPY
jgi:hypothetical protein